MCMHRFSAWIPVLRAWVCEVCANWTAAHVRVPEPVMPHGPGETGWSSDGWGAQLLIRGRDTELGELEKIKEASDAFHACISSMRWSNAVVYVNTVVAAGTAVPMGWFAGGQPAELVAPGDWDRIHAIMGPLDYPGTVFGVGASSLMPDIARRYARGLALHHRDHILPDQRHIHTQEDAQ